jgi:hypothetical protein
MTKCYRNKSPFVNAKILLLLLLTSIYFRANLTSLDNHNYSMNTVHVCMKSLLVAILSACTSYIGGIRQNCGPATKPFLGIDASLF